MIIGIPREIKADEYRVAMLPVGAELLKADGHKVIFQKGAGVGSGFDDAAYATVGAEIVDSAEEVYRQAEMIFAYALGSKSVGGANRAPVGSTFRNRESANVATRSLAAFHANTYQFP